MATHAVDVLIEGTLGQKARQGHLLNGRNRRGLATPLPMEAIGQMGGKHHEAKPQAGSDGAREGVEVHHPLSGVDALKGGNRAALMAELAIVVVLDDVAPLPFRGPGQQLVAAGDGHYRARGEMVRGHDVRNLRPRGSQGRHVHAVFVHGHLRHLSAVDGISASERRVARIFHSEKLTPKKTGQHGVEALGARADDHLPRLDLHIADTRHVMGDSAAQLGQTLARRAFKKKIVGGVLHHLAQDARPHLARERSGRNAAA